MRLYIQSLLGNEWQLDGVKPDTTVETLKLLVYRIAGMHPADQLLYWKRQPLEDYRTVQSYEICDGITLNLHPRLRTGF